MTTSYPSSDRWFEHDHVSCHETQIIPDCFLPQSPNPNPIDHPWDLAQWEFHIIGVQPTNMQPLSSSAIMSVWTKISVMNGRSSEGKMWCQVKVYFPDYCCCKSNLHFLHFAYVNKEKSVSETIESRDFWPFILQSRSSVFRGCGGVSLTKWKGCLQYWKRHRGRQDLSPATVFDRSTAAV